MKLDTEERLLRAMAYALIVAIAIGSSMIAGVLWTRSIAASGVAAGVALVALLRFSRLLNESAPGRRR